MNRVVNSIIFGLIPFGTITFAGESMNRAKAARQIIEECIHKQKAADANVSKVAMIKNCRQQLREQRTTAAFPERPPAETPRG